MSSRKQLRSTALTVAFLCLLVSLTTAVLAVHAIGTSTIAFTEHTIDGAHDGAQGVYATDVDGDGDVDVLGAASTADDITWWENEPSGNPFPDDPIDWIEHPVDDNYNGARSVYAADLDGDDDLDVLGATTSYDEVSIAWWESSPSGNPPPADPFSWTKHSISDDFEGAHAVYATDVDGDGDIDVLGAGFFADDITWWENSPSGAPPPADPISWTQHTIAGNFDGAHDVYAIDLDGDGDTDVLGASEWDEVKWWENDPSGNPPPADPISWTEHIIVDDLGSAYAVYATDMDGDEDVDVLSANYFPGYVTWWENEPSGNPPPADPISWTLHTVDDDFRGGFSIYATDVDGDEDVDICGAAASVDELTWWENDPSGNPPPADPITWTEHTLNDNFDGARSVYATDVDGDSAVDILGAASTADDITWWEQASIYPILSWPGDADYEHDGLHPESGDVGDNYHYRIKYTDPAGDAPGYVQVHIEKDGADIIGSPFSMTCESGDYVAGVICSYTQQGLEPGNGYTYWFEAEDDQGNPATSTHELDAPDVMVLYRVYLPLTFRDAGPPSALVLDDIDNPDGLSQFTVSWSTVTGATSYTLEEDTAIDFPSPTTAYSGSETSTSVSVTEEGTYYYRVRAVNWFGDSPWSNVVSVDVTTIVPPIVPLPGRWDCTTAINIDISFYVSSDSTEAYDGLISTSCGSSSMSGPVPIEDNHFQLEAPDGMIAATFEADDYASGSYAFYESDSCWAIGTMHCEP
jgi:hypothetical protein